MIRSTCRKSWIAASRSSWCIPQRRLVGVAAVKAARDHRQYSTIRDGHDDRTLRQIFDSQSAWQDFSQPSISSITKSRKGLFQNRYLVEPEGFLRFAQDIQRRCQIIVDGVLNTSSVEGYQALPKQFDLLSDLLCRVLDISDFVRATHPDVRFQEAAAEAYAYLWEYMNVLNTTPGLDAQLQKAISSTDISSSWSEEERTVAQILLKDFSHSAILLPQREREQFVAYSNDTKRLGQEFLDDMAPAESRLQFDSAQLKGMNPTVLERYANRRGKIMLPTTGEDAYMALGTVCDENVRRRIYIAGRQAPERQISKLEALFGIRARIARLSGFESYAEMNLADKMATSPEAVKSFLTALSADNASHSQSELNNMQVLKRDLGHIGPINAWDIAYYRNLANSKLRSKSRRPDSMAAYFSLGTVMQGLSRLFSRLYGISFVPRPTSPGETWISDVRRLDIMHETEGHVAVLYCDLFAREGKAPNPAHFTLRCSRRIQDSELLEQSDSIGSTDDGMAVAQSPVNGALYQLPTIALICDFPHPSTFTTPTLLTFRDVQTLFHEMGHAIHSILGRTSLQVVSGTRCPADFAELPSVLMEYFAADPSVLSLFARHWETNAPLPYEMVAETLESQKRWQGLQNETQILYSLVDQAYHSPLGHDIPQSLSSTEVFFDIYDKYSSVREPRETTPQAFFGHLVEYGGMYYSYLFDRAIAGKIWKEVFRAGKDGGGVDRRAGEKYQSEVLKWGGGRNGWACVSGVLGDEKLREGGKEAMEEVGRWGVLD